MNKEQLKEITSNYMPSLKQAIDQVIRKSGYGCPTKGWCMEHAILMEYLLKEYCTPDGIACPIESRLVFGKHMMCVDAGDNPKGEIYLLGQLYSDDDYHVWLEVGDIIIDPFIHRVKSPTYIEAINRQAMGEATLNFTAPLDDCLVMDKEEVFTNLAEYLLYYKEDGSRAMLGKVCYEEYPVHFAEIFERDSFRIKQNVLDKGYPIR